MLCILTFSCFALAANSSLCCLSWAVNSCTTNFVQIQMQFTVQNSQNWLSGYS
jgi:hypothetical protein